MGVDPDHAARPVRLSQAREGSQRHGVVTAQDDRKIVPRARPAPPASAIRLARRLDLRQEPGLLVPDRRWLRRLRSRRCPGPRTRSQARQTGSPARHTGSPRAPCRRRGGPRPGRAPRRSTATLRGGGCEDTGNKANFRRDGEADAAGMIRVLLADDDQPFLDALSPLIERQPELPSSGRRSTGSPRSSSRTSSLRTLS